MARDEVGSWATYAAGVGMEAAPASAAAYDEQVDTLIQYYEEDEREPTVQISPYAHPAFTAALGRRGFVVKDLVTTLTRSLRDLPPLVTPNGFSFREVTGDRAEDVEAFAAAQLEGFSSPPGMRAIMRRVASTSRPGTKDAGCELSLVEHEELGVCGSAGVEYFEGSATLIAGEVHERARRRGVQTALIAYRLAQARARGCEYAVVASIAGGPTERNAVRAGFRPAFTAIDLYRPS